MRGARAAALLLAWAALGGCARSSAGWSAEAAAARHLPLFDDDHDGAVSRAEYLKRRYTGPPFGAVDLDGDGALGAVELLRLGRGQDGQRFDGAAVRPTYPAHRVEAAGFSADQALVFEIVGWMSAALVAAGEAPVDPALLEAAARSGSVESAAAVACLDAMRAPWAARGWAWPAGLP